MKNLIIAYCNKKIAAHEKAKDGETDDYKRGYHTGAIKSYQKIIDLVQNQN